MGASSGNATAGVYYNMHGEKPSLIPSEKLSSSLPATDGLFLGPRVPWASSSLSKGLCIQ